MNYVLKYIIHERETNKTVYRILDKATGRMADASQEYMDTYGKNIDCSNVQNITVKNIAKFTGRLKIGINDFETWCRLHNRLDLLAEYDTRKNEKAVNEISKGDIDPVWWKCIKCDHEWETNIKSRTGKATNSGCPECAYREGRYHKLVVGDNDLETYCKKNGLEHLLKEYSSLNPKKPNEIAAFIHESLSWECSRCGHKFNNYPANRIEGQGCPKCSSAGSSIPEMMIYYFLSEEVTHIEHRKKIDGLEADIYLPDYKTIIDYRGEYWHGTEEKRQIDQKKQQYFSSLGLKQIIIKERTGKEIITHYNPKDKCIYFKPNQYARLFHILKEILKLEIEINDSLLKRVQNVVTTSKQRKEVINSVAETYPDVARRWNSIMNKDFLPTQVTYGTSLKAWFDCDKCHLPYYAFIRKQVNGQGCSYCDGTKAYRGINDIATTLPGILFLWDFEENDKNGITPYNIKAHSNKTVHLKCMNCGEKRESKPNILFRYDNTFRCKACGFKLSLDK